MPPAIRRHGPLSLALLGCLLLAVAEFTELYSIHVITVTVKSATVGSHHGYALLVIAVAAAAMAFGAARGGSRPAAAALILLAVAALVIALAIDLPVVDDTGLYGRDFEQARAQAEIGFKLETAGAVLLLLSAVAILVLRPADEAEPATGRRRRREVAGGGPTQRTST
jgi:hypothetical protein